MAGNDDPITGSLGKWMNQANNQRMKHSERAAELIYRLGTRLDLPEEHLACLRQGMLMHDIGKTEIPAAILNKRGPLTQEEWKLMKRHPEIGYRMVRRAGAPVLVAEIVRYHHENWDGSGYPEHLHGEAIPFFARLAAIVEVWDALMHSLPYRPAWNKEAALAYIRDQSGQKFDPQIIAEFVGVVG